MDVVHLKELQNKLTLYFSAGGYTLTALLSTSTIYFFPRIDTNFHIYVTILLWVLFLLISHMAIIGTMNVLVIKSFKKNKVNPFNRKQPLLTVKLISFEMQGKNSIKCTYSNAEGQREQVFKEANFLLNDTLRDEEMLLHYREIYDVSLKCKGYTDVIIASGKEQFLKNIKSKNMR